MMLSDLIRRAGRSLRSAKGRTILTASAIGVGTFALSMTLAASNGATAYVNKIISDNFDPAELIVTADKAILGQDDAAKPKEYDPNFGTFISNAGATTQVKLVSDADIAKLKAIPGVERVREEIAVNLQYLTREGQKKYVAIAQPFSPYQKPELLAGKINRPLGDHELLLPEGYIKALGFKDAAGAIGQSVTLAVLQQPSADQVRENALQVAQGQIPTAKNTTYLENFTVAAVLKKPVSAQPGTELYLQIGLADAKNLNDIAQASSVNFHKYNFVYVRVADGENASKLTKVQDAIKAMKFGAQSVKDTQAFLTSIIAVLQGIVAAFAAIAIIASVFGIVNTMYISVLQRTREIGLMKALGMRRRDIGRLFRFEAAWIGLLGGGIGSLLAVALGAALNPWITAKLDLGKGNELLIFKPMELIMLVIILMLVSIFAGWLPSRKAAKLDPIEALRTE